MANEKYYAVEGGTKEIFISKAGNSGVIDREARGDESRSEARKGEKRLKRRRKRKTPPASSECCSSSKLQRE